MASLALLDHLTEVIRIFQKYLLSKILNHHDYDFDDPYRLFDIIVWYKTEYLLNSLLQALIVLYSTTFLSIYFLN